jgi:hypothetical protein
VRASLIALALGAFGALLVLVVAGLALGVAADAGGWGSFRIGVGPVLLLEFERHAGSAQTTLGNGVLLAAFSCGLLNAAGAAVLQRRSG